MSGKIKLMIFLVVASLCLSACSRDKDKAKSTTPAPPVERAKRPTLPPPPPPEFLPVTGKVLEILDTGNFIYVSLDWNGKQVWSIVPGVELKVGEMITLDHAAMIQSFHSEALNRTFHKVLFASGIEGKAPRGRAANLSKSNDPRNRRSGRLMASPKSVPPRPTGGKTG